MKARNSKVISGKAVILNYIQILNSCVAKTGDSQCMVLGPAAAAAAASGNLLGIQILTSHPDLLSRKVLFVPRNLGLISSSGDSDAQLKFEDHKVNGQN